jgi:hypothetical protein
VVSDAAPQHFTTVLSADQTVVHVAGVDHVSSLLLGERLTLCRRPVVCQVSAQGFHRHGCSECAVEAVRNGIVFIADRRQATVNLPRFLAALRSRDTSQHHDTLPDGTLPGQRGAVES